MHFGPFDRETAHIDPIQSQQGPLGGETPAGRIEASERSTKGLSHPKAMCQQFIGLVPPVVEVTGDDER
jgi:hypothetical protein